MDPYLLSAALAAFVTAAIHTFIGGPEIARPLLESGDVPTVPKYTHYACWHIVTLTLLAIGRAFLWVGYMPALMSWAGLRLLLHAVFCCGGCRLYSGKSKASVPCPNGYCFSRSSFPPLLACCARLYQVQVASPARTDSIQSGYALGLASADSNLKNKAKSAPVRFCEGKKRRGPARCLRDRLAPNLAHLSGVLKVS